MGAMAFQRKLPFFPLLQILRVAMQTVPYQKTRLPRTTILLFARKLHVSKTPMALCVRLRLRLRLVLAPVPA